MRWIAAALRVLRLRRSTAPQSSAAEPACAACGGLTGRPVMCDGCWAALSARRQWDVATTHPYRHRDAMSSYHYRLSLGAAVSEARSRRGITASPPPQFVRT